MKCHSINAITYTDAHPTIPELWPKEVDAVRQVAINRFTGATHIIMNATAWGFHLAALDTTGRPFVRCRRLQCTDEHSGHGRECLSGSAELCSAASSCSPAVSRPTSGGGTNETRIIAVDMRDVFLYEDPNMPIYIKAEETLAANLQVLYVLSQLLPLLPLAVEPKAISAISGTGMILPAL